MSGITGKCPKCGQIYCGWALVDPDFQKCEKCGSALDIRRDGFPLPNHNSSVANPGHKIAGKKTEE